MMFCLEADLRPDAADPKKKSTDHMMPVADEGKEEKKEETKEEKEEKEEKKSTEHAVADEEEKKEEKKENGTSALFTLHGIRIKKKIRIKKDRHQEKK